jgi:hypothetical protein
MTRAERKARQARGAVTTLARMFAKNAVKAHIRSQGLWLGDFSPKEITLWAEIWLREHPAIFAQARVWATEFGYETEIAQCPTSTTTPSTISLPSSRS